MVGAITTEGRFYGPFCPLPTRASALRWGEAPIDTFTGHNSERHWLKLDQVVAELGPRLTNIDPNSTNLAKVGQHRAEFVQSAVNSRLRMTCWRRPVE